MTKRTIAFAACLALAAGTLAACGGGDKTASSTSTPAPTTPAAPTAKPPAATGGVVAVDIKDIKFVPATVTVKAGQTVRWTNSDPVAHTVTAKSGSTVDSGTIASGKTYETKFTKAGKVDYVCTIHPGQAGTVIVQ
jgi:plastocyanin